MTEKTPSILVQRISARMDALGLNPFSAATKAGLGSSFVRDILRGKVKQPGADNLAKLALALECSLGFLLGAEDIGPPASTDARLPPLPEPLEPAPPPKHKGAALLPIKFELLANALRKASDVARAPIGWEGATIPEAYEGRKSWWEVLRDDTMSSVAPNGSLVQVVEMTDEDRPLIKDGDYVIITKRLAGDDAAYNWIERSMRRVVYRYPEIGLSFLEFHNEAGENLSDDIWSQPKAPAEEWRARIDAIEDPEERERSVADMRLRIDLRKAAMAKSPEKTEASLKRVQHVLDNPAELERIIRQAEKFRPRLVGKAIKVLTPLNQPPPYLSGKRPDQP